MTDTPPSPFSTDHKLGLNIAEFIANYSILEIALYQALADMLDDSTGEITEAILSRVDSVSYKMGVVFDIAALKRKTNACAVVITNSEKEIRRLTALRNELAHGIFASNEKAEIGVFSNVFRVGRKKPGGRMVVRSEIVEGVQSMVAIMQAVSASTANGGVSLHRGAITITPRTDHG